MSSVSASRSRDDPAMSRDFSICSDESILSVVNLFLIYTCCCRANQRRTGCSSSVLRMTEASPGGGLPEEEVELPDVEVVGAGQ